jgi:hypothetical protein
MSVAERIQGWNRAYDSLPEDSRFQVILWPLILLGAINMALTVGSGFPFGVLVMLAVLVLSVIRVPYLRSRGAAPTPVAVATPKITVSEVPWVYDLNLWYDGLPELRRPYVILVVLMVAGGLNMLLTIHSGFPFGLLFLLAVLGMVAIRMPYVAGWLVPLTPPREKIAAAPPPPQIVQEPAIYATPMEIAPPDPEPMAHAAPMAPAPEPAPMAMPAEPPPPMLHDDPPPPAKPV